MSDERVFVVPRSSVIDEADWHGLRTDGLGGFVSAMERDGRYEPRARMERDPAFKQVIPYLVLRDGERFFLMRRTAAGGDARLHGRYSIGVGGHLNPGDGGLLGGLRREWAEELVADFVPEFRLVALLNDDTTEVGAVHLGAVYLADAAGRPVAIREVDKLSGAFVEPLDVAGVIEGMETWSRLVFDFLVHEPTVSTDPRAYEARATSHPRSVFAFASGAGPIIGAPGDRSELSPDPAETLYPAKPQED